MTYERKTFRILNPNSTPACSFYSSTRIQDWNDNFSAVSHKNCWYDQEFIKQFSLPPQLICTGRNNHLNRSKHLVKQATPNPYDILVVSFHCYSIGIHSTRKPSSSCVRHSVMIPAGPLTMCLPTSGLGSSARLTWQQQHEETTLSQISPPLTRTTACLFLVSSQFVGRLSLRLRKSKCGMS